MPVPFDVQVLEGDVDDLVTTAKLWRSFLDNRISMLRMTTTCENYFCGIGCYKISYRMSCSCLSPKILLFFLLLEHEDCGHR